MADLTKELDKALKSQSQQSLRRPIEQTIDSVVDNFWGGDATFKKLLKETAAHEALFGKMDRENPMQIDPIQTEELRKDKYAPQLAVMGVRYNEDGEFDLSDLRTNVILGGMTYLTKQKGFIPKTTQEGRAKQWKDFYNTKSGEGKPADYLKSLEQFDMREESQQQSSFMDFLIPSAYAQEQKDPLIESLDSSLNKISGKTKKDDLATSLQKTVSNTKETKVMSFWDKMFSPYVKANEALGKGITQTIVESPQVIGSLIREMGERAEESPKWYDWLNPIVGPAAGFAKKVRAERMKKSDWDEKVAKWGKGLIEANKRFVDKRMPELNEQEKTTMERFMKDLGSGATTLLGAVGLTALTKSPHAAAVAFGTYQKGQIYQEGREAGKTPEAAGRLSTATGVAEGALEYIGLKWMFSRLGGGKLINFFKKGALEAIQEWSQQTSENVITRVGGIREMENWTDIFEGSGRAALIGALLGGPTGLAVDFARNKGIQKQLEEKGLPEREANELAEEIVETQSEYIKPKVKEEVDEITKEVKEPEPTQPLIEEAKKYKSAEEMWETQSKVYHGTSAKFEDFDLGFGGAITEAKSATRAIFFVDNPKIAKGYAVYAAEEGVVKEKLRKSEELEKKAQRLQAEGKNKESSKLFDESDKLIGEAEELSRSDIAFERRKQAEVKEVVLRGDFLEVDAQGKTPQELSKEDDIDSWLNQQLDIAKKQGKDGVIFRNLDDTISLQTKPATHYAVFDKSSIKTKSQLTDIWKQAQGEGAKEIKAEEKSPIEKETDRLNTKKIKGRLSQLEQKSNDILKEIKILERQKDRLKKTGKPTKALQNTIDNLYSEFDILDSEIADLMITEEEAINLDKEKIQVKAKELDSLSKRIQKATERETKAELKKLNKQKESKIKSIKESIISYANENLSLKDRGKLLSAVKNAKKIDDVLNAVSRIDRLQEMTNSRKYRDLITKELKKTKVRKQAGKPISRFGPEVQRVLDIMRTANKMKVSDAKQAFKNSLNQDPTKLSPEKKVENLIHRARIGDMKADEIKGLLNMIKDIKKGGRVEELEKAMRWKEQKEAWIDNAINTITGGKGITWTKTAGVKEFQEGGLRGKVAQIGKSQVGWQDLMDILSYNSKAEEGKSFFNAFANVFEVSMGEIEGNRIAFESIRDMGMKAYNLKNTKKFADKLFRDLKDNFVYTFTNANGEVVTVEMNRSQVRKRYMELKDPSLTDMFMSQEGMAYTEDIVNAIDDFLTDGDKAFVQAQMDFYKYYYDKVNPVYREAYGVDLPFNEFYSPIAREDIDFDKMEGFTSLMEEIQERSSVTTGSMKSRVKNYHRIKEQSDTTVLQKHVVDAEHFINWLTKIKQMRAVFGNSKVRQAIKAYYGKGMNSKISEFIEDFTRNGMSRAKRVEGLDRLRANFARSVLAIKPNIGVKQLTSYLAYLEAMPTIDFVAGQLDFFSNPLDIGRKVKLLLGTEYMKARGQNLTRDIKLAMQTDEFQNFRGNPNFWNSLMLNIRAGDKGAIAVGGWSLYKYQRKLGKSHEEAIREFERFTDRTQQSGRIEQLSSVQRGGSWAKLFTMFKSAPQQYFRKELTASKNIMLGKGSKIKALKALAIYHILLPGLFQYVSNWFHWDKEDQLRAAILGPLNGLPLIGDALEAGINYAFGKRAYDVANPVSGVAKNATKTVGLLVKMTAEAIGEKEFLEKEENITNKDIRRAVEGILEAGGALKGIPLGTGFRMSEGLWKLGVGEYEEGMAELLGWSPFIIKKLKEENKLSSSLKDVFD